MLTSAFRGLPNVPVPADRDWPGVTPMSSPHLRPFVARVLVEATGTTTPDAAAFAAAFSKLCERLRSRLQPLFGTTAVAALFARALHLSALEYPWLVDVVQENGARCALDTVKTAPSSDIQQGLAALLAHDIALLSTFIGEDMVFPLVQQAWGTEALPRETKSEGKHE
jgi:hypothetical protein